jgi:hypothetical protein
LYFGLPQLLQLSALTPVPLSEQVCGLPGALSVNESVPSKLPVSLGEKVTLVVQLAPDARLELHVLVSPKSTLVAILMSLSVIVP